MIPANREKSTSGFAGAFTNCPMARDCTFGPKKHPAADSERRPLQMMASGVGVIPSFVNPVLASTEPWERTSTARVGHIARGVSDRRAHLAEWKTIQTKCDYKAGIDSTPR
jgi:hypothetical protein